MKKLLLDCDDIILPVEAQEKGSIFGKTTLLQNDEVSLNVSNFHGHNQTGLFVVQSRKRIGEEQKNKQKNGK